MKYLVALFLGASLLANSQAFADEYIFRGDENDWFTSPDVCVDAAKNGVELYTSVEEGEPEITRWYLHEERIYLLTFGFFKKQSLAVVQCFILKQDEVVPR